MIDVLRVAELIEHAQANQVLVEEHRQGLDRAIARRLIILQALTDLGVSKAQAARYLGMTRSRATQVLKDAEEDGSP